MSNYHKRILKGLCGLCGGENPGGPTCEDCKTKAKARSAAKREERAVGGTCIGCGNEVEGGTRCGDCKEKQKASRAKTVAKKKEAGICVSCTKPVKPGCTLCQEHIDKLSETTSKHYAKRKEAGTCYYCQADPEPNSSMCTYHRELYKDYRAKIKREALDAYGGPVCVGKNGECGCDNEPILEIDHEFGGGTQHRKDLKMEGAGHQFYLWLRRENYPKGFRVLCPNCNRQAHYDRMRAAAETKEGN